LIEAALRLLSGSSQIADTTPRDLIAAQVISYNSAIMYRQ